MALDKILVVGKNSNTQELIRSYTKELFAADDMNDLWDMIHNVDPHAILFDEHIPHDHICDFLQNAQARELETPVVVIGDDSNTTHSIDKLKKLGLFDYIERQKDAGRLGQIIDRIRYNTTETQNHTRFFSQECPGLVSIVGKSQAMINALKMIQTVAKSTCNPVLIIGETGTGKELAAKGVHILRNGSDKKFVALNCAALTATLLESELFGHVKGAFTSADKDKVGLLELAEDGTIFLDEISEMPLDLQAKLLRVIQEKVFRRVGGTLDKHCQATIIASSNQNLHKSVEANKFRRDLYYRLAICPIILAPLRIPSRKADILLLAEYFLKTSSICPEKQGKIHGLTKMAQDALLNHSWPGNVRELKNVIDRAIMLETSDKIGTQNLMIHPEQFMDVSYEAPSAGLKDFSLERAERELVARALQESGWQKTRAAALLGITRATLYAKINQYNLTEPGKKKEHITTA